VKANFVDSDELNQSFEQLNVQRRFIDVFGDCCCEDLSALKESFEGEVLVE
jgi:hypothetical protein